MKLSHFIFCLSLGLAAGLVTVAEHAEGIRAGYRVHQLAERKRRLLSAQRRLELFRFREERGEVLWERARHLDLRVSEAASPGGIGTREIARR